MTILLRLFGFFSSPIGMIVAGVIALSGYVLYQRNDAVNDERAKVETRKVNEIKKTTKAREGVRADCARTPAGCLPGTFFRD